MCHVPIPTGEVALFWRLLFVSGCSTTVAQARFFVFYLRLATQLVQVWLLGGATSATTFGILVALVGVWQLFHGWKTADSMRRRV